MKKISKKSPKIVAIILALALIVPIFITPIEADAARGSWIASNGKWNYQLSNGSLATSWQMIDGTWYYFAPYSVDGCKQYEMLTGGWTINGQLYYFHSSGAMATGWVYLNESWYYFQPGSGAAAKGWKAIGGTWYYFEDDGIMATGWELIGNIEYYFDSTGAMQTGWLKWDDVWFYFHSSGAMATGWQLIGGIWYYFEPVETEYAYSGEMVTGLVPIGNEKYYFDANGAMATGWILIGTDWYYFLASGAAAKNQWVGNYYMLSDGKMATNQWIGQYYVGSDGLWIPGYKEPTVPNEPDVPTEPDVPEEPTYKKGWNNIEGKWYYFSESGAVMTGWQLISGTWYYFYTDENSEHCLGEMVVDWQLIGGNWYYFNADGSMVSNAWVGDYYLGSNGAMLRDTWIDGYYVDGYGKCVYDQWYNIHVGNGQYVQVYGHFDEYYADQVIQQLNAYRVANGLGELEKHTALMNAAKVRGVEITHTWSHTRPDGSSCFTAIEEDFWSMGENVAMGQSNPTAVMTAWKNSQGHNENMLMSHYTYIGVSCFRAKVGNGYYNYWVQMFGRKY